MSGGFIRIGSCQVEKMIIVVCLMMLVGDCVSARSAAALLAFKKPPYNGSIYGKRSAPSPIMLFDDQVAAAQISDDAYLASLILDQQRSNIAKRRELNTIVKEVFERCTNSDGTGKLSMPCIELVSLQALKGIDDVNNESRHKFAN